eukprot:Em0793g3a
MVFNDPTHGHIELHPLLVKIIDTPQFQRLRYIKQLGHGPFSHMFDLIFIPRVNPDSKWRHEQASVEMFDHMVEVNGLKEEFESGGLGAHDITFVKEQIAGPLQPTQGRRIRVRVVPECGPTVEGRRRRGSCMSKRLWPTRGMEVDVDKWDYFCARIVIAWGWQIILTGACYSEGAMALCSVVMVGGWGGGALDGVGQDQRGLVKANDHLLLPGKNGPVKIADAIHDMVAYTRLTDSVTQLILLSTDPNLKTDTAAIAREIINSLTPDELEGLPPLTIDDIVVCVITFDYGMKKDNPVSQMLPHKFAEQQVHVYCKRERPSQSEGSMEGIRQLVSQAENVLHQGSGDMLQRARNQEEEEEPGYTPYGTPFGTPAKT